MANLKIETMPIGDLTPYHRNPRRGNMAAIAESLKARGQYKPIVVNKGTKTGIANEILAGNHTWQAAKSLGWTTIEASSSTLTRIRRRRSCSPDNRIADLGGYDTDALAELLESIEQRRGAPDTARTTSRDHRRREARAQRAQDPAMCLRCRRSRIRSPAKSGSSVTACSSSAPALTTNSSRRRPA